MPKKDAKRTTVYVPEGAAGLLRSPGFVRWGRQYDWLVFPKLARLLARGPKKARVSVIAYFNPPLSPVRPLRFLLPEGLPGEGAEPLAFLLEEERIVFKLEDDVRLVVPLVPLTREQGRATWPEFLRGAA